MQRRAPLSLAAAKLKRVNPYRVPVLNCIYEIFLDEPPTVEQINGILEAFAFLASILMTMVGALMTGIDFDQCNTLREKSSEYSEGGTIKLLSGEAIDPYYRFVRYVAVGFNCISACVINLVVMWMCCGTITFDRDGYDSKVAFAAWWKWARFPLITLLVLVAISVALFAISACYAFSLQNADSPQKLADLIYWTDAGNYAFLLAIGVAVPISMLSMALIRRESMHSLLERELRLEEEKASEVILQLGRDCGHQEGELAALVERAVDHHWLETAADLIRLDDASWKRLKFPLKLESRIRKELASEDFHLHRLRRHRASMANLDEAEAAVPLGGCEDFTVDQSDKAPALSATRA